MSRTTTIKETFGSDALVPIVSKYLTPSVLEEMKTDFDKAEIRATTVAIILHNKHELSIKNACIGFVIPEREEHEERDPLQTALVAYDVAVQAVRKVLSAFNDPFGKRYFATEKELTEQAQKMVDRAIDNIDTAAY